VKLDLVIEELHRSENELRHELLVVSKRHKADHEVFHVARDLSQWSADHVRDLAQIGRDFGLELDPEAEGEVKLAERLREKSAELLGRRSTPGLLMLRDLRELYLKASGVSLDWEMLAQAAQGARKLELLELAERCHPDTLRVARWANGKLKVSATQVLVS
jgi:hypothetical protein